MRSLYDARTSADFYKIVRPQYLQNKRLFYKQVPQLSIIPGNDRRLNVVNESLEEASALDFSFVLLYLKKCKYNYHMQYQYLKFFILSAKPLSAADKNKIQNTAIRLLTVMQLYNMQRPMNIYIIMNPIKRHLPSRGLIDTEHINGGFTYISKNNVFVIRKEEYEKVLIHELLHHNKYIHNDYYAPSNIQRLKRVFNIDDRYNLYPNEAIIEVFSCILNTVFYAIDYNKTLRDFKKLLNADCLHSLTITNKIIDIQKNKKWYEKTNAYAYCVFKTILYHNFDMFIKKYEYNNDDMITDFLCKNARNVIRLARKCSYTDKSLKLTLF